MIYIQANKEQTLPHHFDAACAMYGVMESALDFRLISFDELNNNPKFNTPGFIQNNCFVGSVEFMREVFKRIGKTDVRVPLNSDREHEIITLEEAHKRIVGGKKLFIKPVEIKLFTGLVLDGCVYSCLKTLPDDTLVMAYEPFPSKIVSEWRIYIHNHKIVDARNYSGDFKIHPDYSFAEIKILNNKFGGEKYGTPNPVNAFPCAYTIDIGILESCENVIVEYNDMWAIGNYGMDNSLYLKMLMDRYFEIVKS